MWARGSVLRDTLLANWRAQTIGQKVPVMATAVGMCVQLEQCHFTALTLGRLSSRRLNFLIEMFTQHRGLGVSLITTGQ